MYVHTHVHKIWPSFFIKVIIWWGHFPINTTSPRVPFFLYHLALIDDPRIPHVLCFCWTIVRNSGVQGKTKTVIYIYMGASVLLVPSVFAIKGSPGYFFIIQYTIGVYWKYLGLCQWALLGHETKQTLPYIYIYIYTVFFFFKHLPRQITK